MPSTPIDTTLDDGVRAALGQSNLRDLPPGVVTRLADGSTLRRTAAGAILHREGDTDPHLELVVGGLIRVFVVGVDGRTLTVRYVRPGALLGAVSLYAPRFRLPATIQAIVESAVLVFSPDAVRRLVDHDPRVARALLVELSERVQSFLAEIPWGAFAPVRRRIARHLLDLAAAGLPGPALEARVSQAQLAAECGTVREVVVRELRELRAMGVVETRRDSITILDPARLLVVAGEPRLG